MRISAFISVIAALLLGHVLAAVEPLVVYCGRKQALVGPQLDRFTEETGIPLDVRYNKTPALAAQLATEDGESPADVFYAQESGYLGALAKSDMLATIPAELLDQVDPRFRAADGLWIGVTGRLRVMVYNTAGVGADELPSTLEDFADPKWKGRIGWAPGNASFQAHVSVLRHAWGDEATKEWLLAVKDNGAKAYPKNSPQVRAAHAGEIDIGWVNHYYLHKLKKPGYQAANASFSEDGKIGNVLMVSGMGVIGHSERQADAHKLVAFLIGESAQRHFASEGYEYPVRPGIEAHPDVTPLAEIPLAKVDQRHLTDVGPTIQMLREVGLQ